MLRVGLTGGLACGKSFVGHELAELGCYLIEADKLGHEVMRPGAEAYAAIVREFGPEVVAEDGLIDRRKLSALVWDHPDRLARLNSFVHPAVWAREQQRMSEIAQAHPQAIAVVEAAILVETGSYKTFDKLIVVTCTAEQQMERAMHRGSYSRQEVLARIGRQLPIEEKLRLADYVIDTSGSKENTQEQVRTVYASLRNLAAGV
jgi:dephospho-CoA kinase